MDIRGLYNEIGGDYQRVFARLNSNDVIAEGVKRLAQSNCYNTFLHEYMHKNSENACRAVYELSEMAVSLGFDRLSSACLKITDAMLGGKNEVTEAMLAELNSSYKEATRIINKYI
ncbi:hypothetical protein [Eubacterium sp.]|uniref:hypothetical protein n=1 Tax=Eubacterium sp. TaxID=142586 RepID=UPI003F054C3D